MSADSRDRSYTHNTQMGPRRSDVLEVVYGVLFKMSLEIAMLLRYKKSFAANNAIKHNLACAYMEILTVISDATVQCIKNEKCIEHASCK